MRWLESLTDDSATLQSYLQAIARFPSLTTDEESALAERTRRRDGEAIARLVESHLGAVVRYVLRYEAVGAPLLSLVRDGNLALIEAARRFDPARHGRFAGYARWWVRQSVLHRMAQLGAEAATGEAARTDGRVPDALSAAVEHAGVEDDLAAEHLSTRDLRQLDRWWRRLPLADGDLVEEPVNTEAVGPALGESEDVVRRALVAELEASMLALDPRERRALGQRLGLGTTAPGLPRATRKRPSAERAAQLSARAVRKLCGQRYLRSALN
ncbi:MAG: sigma-70 family RNA polymerase sigma factor [Vicinamibacterales bacterium]